MNTRTLLRRSLVYYWRTNAAVAAGVATAVAVLAGALLVGSSVRASLRELVNARLGRADVVLWGSQFFREDLSRRLSGAVPACPLIALEGFVVDDSSGRRAGRVYVYGVDARFWAFHGLDPARAPTGRDAVISSALAREVGTKANGSVVVGLEQPSAVPGASLFSRKEERRQMMRVWVREALDGPPGEFSLVRDQGVVRAIFVPLDRLQRELRQDGRVNLVLFSGLAADTIRQRVRSAATLEDVGLRLRSVEGGDAIAVESASGLLDDSVVTAIDSVADARRLRRMPILTYLANTIRVGNRQVPYAVVTATDAFWRDGSPTPDSRDIVLNEWTARELNARAGDVVTLDYYVWHDEGRLTTQQAKFVLTHVVPMTGLAADRQLAPEYPGITGAESLSDWDPPFPLDLRRIRPQDEKYWDEFGATPKAFVPLAAGQALWRLRYGRITSIRLYGNRLTASALEPDVLRAIDPVALGMRVEDVRSAGLSAAQGATDFGQYFFYFSFFVVVSALMLAGMFFKLGVEQRVREIGVLGASGFAGGDIRRVFSIEAMAIAAAGAAVGVLAALVYAALVLLGLRTWWIGAVGTDRIALHIATTPLVFGAVAGMLAGLLSLWWTLRRVRRVSVRRLLAGEVGAAEAPEPIRRRGARVATLAGYAAAATAIGLPAIVWARVVPAPAGFFGAGAAAMVAAAAFTLRRLQRPAGSLLRAGAFALPRLGMRNASHRPARTVLGMALIAFASFIILSVDAFRREHDVDPRDPKSGTGGYAVVAESAVPLYHDLATSEGREALNLSALSDDVRIARFRLRPGDDASCVNLYVPQRPRIIAPEQAFLREGRFRFAAPAADNPWPLLEATLPEDVVPAIADQTTMQYVLHKRVGDEIVIDQDTNRPFRLRLVAALADSVLQGELIVSERDFIKLFPQYDGYRFFLVEVPADGSSQSRQESVIATLEDVLSDLGFDATPATERLAGFHRVENTYLATFQSLGALGLVLGTIGLASVVIRNVLERRRELALLRASGFTRLALGATILAEHALIVGGGLAIGTMAALIAAAPVVAARGGGWPWHAVAMLMVAVPLAGLGSSVLATWAALKARLVDVLKSEA